LTIFFWWLWRKWRRGRPVKVRSGGYGPKTDGSNVILGLDTNIGSGQGGSTGPERLDLTAGSNPFADEDTMRIVPWREELVRGSNGGSGEQPSTHHPKMERALAEGMTMTQQHGSVSVLGYGLPSTSQNGTLSRVDGIGEL